MKQEREESRTVVFTYPEARKLTFRMGNEAGVISFEERAVHDAGAEPCLTVCAVPASETSGKLRANGKRMTSPASRPPIKESCPG
jgi:hypothetical protein